jgi:hypothetical protein
VPGEHQVLSISELLIGSPKQGQDVDTLKDAVRSLTDSLPSKLRDFLDGGGWWIILAFAATGLVLLIARLTWRPRKLRSARLLDGDRKYRENLFALAPTTLPTLARRLTVYHLPVRVGLVVVAPAGTEHAVDRATVGQLLDRVIPGLQAIAVDDQARIRFWPPQMSQPGFAHAFQRRMQRPEVEGQPSHWVLVSGAVQVGRQTVLIGMALWTDQPTTLGKIALEPHQWLDALRIKATA